MENGPGTAGATAGGVGATTGTSVFSKFKRSKAKVKGQDGGGTEVETGGTSSAGNTISSKNSKDVNGIQHSLSSGDSGYNDEFSAI